MNYNDQFYTSFIKQKIDALEKAGVIIAPSPAKLGYTMFEAMKK